MKQLLEPMLAKIYGAIRRQWATDEFEGLRPVIEGSVVTIHSGLYEKYVQSLSLTAPGLDLLFTQARVHCGNKPRHFGLDHDYDMTFLTSPVNISTIHLKDEYGARSKGRATPIVTSRGNYGNNLLTMLFVKIRCVRDANTFNIGVFSAGKNDVTKIKHIYNEPAYLFDSCNDVLTSMIGGISDKPCQWLALRVWWYALAFVTHEITWRQANWWVWENKDVIQC